MGTWERHQGWEVQGSEGTESEKNLFRGGKTRCELRLAMCAG